MNDLTVLQAISDLYSQKFPSSMVHNTYQDNTQASLVAQWLRTCLSMQGTRVRALVWEDPTWPWSN